MAGHYVGLRRGRHEISLVDIETGNYAVVSEFRPPATTFVPIVGTGTFSNRLGGELIERSVADKNWNFRINIKGDSAAERSHAAQRLEAFLNAGSPNEPVYLLIRPHNNFPFEPKWGQADVYYRYEIITANLTLMGSLERVSVSDHPEYRVDVVMKGYAIGKPHQRVGQAVGGVFEDVLGKSDGQARGTMIPRSGAQRSAQPDFRARYL